MLAVIKTNEMKKIQLNFMIIRNDASRLYFFGLCAGRPKTEDRN